MKKEAPQLEDSRRLSDSKDYHRNFDLQKNIIPPLKVTDEQSRLTRVSKLFA